MLATKLYELLRGIPIKREVAEFMSQRAEFVDTNYVEKLKDRFTLFLKNNIPLVYGAVKLSEDYPISIFLKKLCTDLDIYRGFPKDIKMYTLERIANFLNDVLVVLCSTLNFYEKGNCFLLFGADEYLKNMYLYSIFLNCSPESYINLNRAYLPFTDFGEMTLSNVDFNDAYLEGSNFSHSRLYNVNFKNSFLKHAFFIRADISECSFKYANLTRSVYRASSLVRCDFSSVTFNDTEFNKNDIDAIIISENGTTDIIYIEDVLKKRFGNQNFVVEGKSTSLSNSVPIENDQMFMRVRDKRFGYIKR